MKTNTLKGSRFATTLWSIALLLISPLLLTAQDSQALERRVLELERELAQVRAQLSESTARTDEAEATLEQAADTGPAKIRIGDFTIGGAIRANWVLGDYPSSGAPSRGGHGGNFELDTFRINVDYANEAGIIGKLEYRWYNGYNFLHTGWIGMKLDEASTVQLGVNRVPFGPGPYGVSNSWFFDQHYYVGLSDDMDFGIKYTTTRGDWTIDLAYYFSDEGNWRGASRDSARYSYDIVPAESGNGYRERHQFNARAIYAFDSSSLLTAVGGSLQYGRLDAVGTTGSNGNSVAASVHGSANLGGFNLNAQLTWYHHDIGADNEWATGDLIFMGAYDFAWPVATKAWIPAVTLSRTYTTNSIDWLDSITPYIEYSSIMKDVSAFNDSQMLILGAAWARGGWYIYTDIAYSNGNYFVGSDGDDYSSFAGVGDFGINGNDSWNVRYNANFGYYF